MSSQLVRALKFTGIFSLALLSGFSYSLSVLSPRFLLSIHASDSSSKALKSLSRISVKHLRKLGGVSSVSFILAYFFSPRAQKHPYLLWSTLFIGTSYLIDLLPASIGSISNLSTIAEGHPHEFKASKANRQLDASYEDLSRIDHSDGEHEEEDGSYEELCARLKTYTLTERVRVSLIGIGFGMSVVGIWGDRYSNLITGAL